MAKVQEKKVKFISKWDEDMQKIWEYPKVPEGFSLCKEDRRNVRWWIPRARWVKLNFDGASQGNSGMSGFGSIIINEKGDLLWETYGFLRTSSNNDAKRESFLRGQAMCSERIPKGGN
ncbi:hypothetical protein SUGI_0223940 [Cryptomeria japonica]|nr:hypothetical protein SUGI_0223940 [Cryptomeria japonica]